MDKFDDLKNGLSQLDELKDDGLSQLDELKDEFHEWLSWRMSLKMSLVSLMILRMRWMSC